MTALPGSITSKLLELKSRKLPDDEYLQALTELTGLQDVSETWTTVDRVQAMRMRIEELERKVKELEALK